MHPNLHLHLAKHMPIESTTGPPRLPDEQQTAEHDASL